jgi:hypothetical protein
VRGDGSYVTGGELRIGLAAVGTAGLSVYFLMTGKFVSALGALAVSAGLALLLFLLRT